MEKLDRKPSVIIPKLDTVTGKIGQFGQWASNQNWQGYGQWMAHQGELGQRVLVMNPMHIVHLSSDTKSKLVKIIEFCRGFTEKWFSHLLLLCVLIFYALIGAWIFIIIEGGYEGQAKAPVASIREKLKSEVWRFTHQENLPRKRLDEVIDIRMQEFEDKLYERFASGGGPDSAKISWTFWNAVVYCFTVFTTIGYGHIAPVTKVGRIVTIFYACIGIPLLLMVLADLGKLFTRCIKCVFRTIKKIFYAKRLKKMRRAGRRATLVQQNITSTLKSHGLKFISDVKKNRENAVTKNDDSQETQSQRQDEVEEEVSRNPSRHASFTNLPGVTITSPVTPFMYPTAATGPGGEPIVILSPRIGTPSPGHLTPNLIQSGSTSTPGLSSTAEDGGVTVDEMDDEFNLPVSLALFILFLYMFSGAWVFTVTDNWSFVDAIYFVFISTSTVGFGDLIPKSEWSMIALSVYLLFGLALTSMCINVIQEQLAVAFEEAKLRLGTRMGIDVETNLLEDSVADSKSMTGGGGGGGDGNRAGSRRESKDIHSQEDSKKKRSKKSLEENNNQRNSVNNTTASIPSTKQTALASSFEMKKDQIGKALLEKREQKKPPLNHETSASLNPLPTTKTVMKPRSDLTSVPMSNRSLVLPVSSSTPSLDSCLPQKVPRKIRPSQSPKRSVNFDEIPSK